MSNFHLLPSSLLSFLQWAYNMALAKRLGAKISKVKGKAISKKYTVDTTHGVIYWDLKASDASYLEAKGM